MKTSILAALLFCSVLCLAACNESTDKAKSNSQTETKKLRLSCIAFSEPEVQAGIKALEAKGYKVELIPLQNATMMCEALDNNELDAALQAHQPWIDSYNRAKSKNIVMLKPYIHKNVFGMFSLQHKSIDEIKEGAKIVIPQDDTNIVRAMFMLEQLGFIKLRDGVTNPTDIDIVENYKGIEIIKIDTQQIISAIRDVDAVCNAKLYLSSNKVTGYTELAQSNDLDKFGVGFTVANANKDAPWVKDLIQAYTSEEEREAINTLYQGSCVPGF